MGGDAARGWVVDLGGDGLGVVGFIFSNSVLRDDFAGEGIPEEEFFAGFVGGDGLAAGDNFVNLNHCVIISYLL